MLLSYLSPELLAQRAGMLPAEKYDSGGGGGGEGHAEPPPRSWTSEAPLIHPLPASHVELLFPGASVSTQKGLTGLGPTAIEKFLSAVQGPSQSPDATIH